MGKVQHHFGKHQSFYSLIWRDKVVLGRNESETQSGMQVVRALDEVCWRDFVDNHPRGNIFHTPEMFRVFARTERYRRELWAAVNAQSEILALFLR